MTAAPNPSSSDTKLLPCPFCGSEAIDRREIDGFPMIYCNGDDCFGPQTTAKSFDDAVVQWNTRTPALPSGQAEAWRWKPHGSSGWTLSFQRPNHKSEEPLFLASTPPQIALTDEVLRATEQAATKAAAQVQVDAYVDPALKHIPTGPASTQIAGDVREAKLAAMIPALLERAESYVLLNGLNDSHSTNLISDLANMVRALSPQAKAGEIQSARQSTALPSGESGPSVTTDCAGAGTVAQASLDPCPYEDGKSCVLEDGSIGPCLCVNPVAQRPTEPRWEYQEASLFRDGVCVFHWAPFTEEQNRQITELVNDANTLPASPPAALPAGEVTLSIDEAYALFLIVDTTARVERGISPTTNYLRDRLMPTYRDWHDANPGTAHPALAIPSTNGNTP